MKLLKLLVVTAVLTIGASAQTTVFSDDFETNNLSKWSNGATGGCAGVTSVATSSTRAHSGTYSLKAVYDSPTLSSDCNRRAENWDRVMPGDTGMFVDYWVFHATPAAGSAGGGPTTSTGKEIRFTGTDVHFDWFIQPLNGASNTTADWQYVFETENTSYGETTYYFGNSSQVWDTWKHIQAYVKYNTTNSGNASGDGIIQVWIDGVLSLNVSNAVFRNIAVDAAGTNANQLWLGAQSQNNVAVITRYFDDLQICSGTSCGSTAAPAVTLSASSHSFGTQTTNSTSGAYSFTITNSGTATLTFSGISLTGTNSGDFAISSNTCGSTLSPGVFQ